MALGKRFAELTGLDITNLISNVVESFADKSAYSLGESQHAPKKETHHSQQVLGNRKGTSRLSPSSPPISLTSSPFLAHTPHRSTFCHNNLDHSPKEKTAPMGQLADVDDTAGFMAAARSLKLEKEYGKPPAASEADASEQQASQINKDAVEDFGAATNSGSGGFDAPSPSAENNGDFIGLDADEAKLAPCHEADRTITSYQPLNADSPAFIPGSEMEELDLQESPDKLTASNLKALAAHDETEGHREHLKTFKSWGTPVARDKPAAQIRRVIIKSLPPSWATADKVLSIVHGGMIESINVTSGGTAHVLFCEPDACRAFYDKYPNGIDLDKERKLTAFVDLGEDVDVVSSQFAFNLSVGATRVVRAVGVEMKATMSDIVNIATAANRKIEKIVGSYVPGYPRSVSFRFCSIEDAVRFRAALVRNEDWEQCNIQYATDPCEVATGYHAD